MKRSKQDDTETVASYSLSPVSKKRYCDKSEMHCRLYLCIMTLYSIDKVHSNEQTSFIILLQSKTSTITKKGQFLFHKLQHYSIGFLFITIVIICIHLCLLKCLVCKIHVKKIV